MEKKEKEKTAERKRLTTGGRVSGPRQLLLPRPAALAVGVEPDAAKTQQEFFAGDLHGADGVQGLVRDKGQRVVT